MACDAQTLENLLTVDGYSELSSRDKLMCLAAVYGTAAGLNATTAMALAASNGYLGLADDALDQAFLAAIC